MGSNFAANATNASNNTTMNDAGWGKVRLVQMAAGADSSWLKGTTTTTDHDNHQLQHQHGGGEEQEQQHALLQHQHEQQQRGGGHGGGHGALPYQQLHHQHHLQQQLQQQLQQHLQQQQSFARPPTPLEILDSAWEMVVSERVEGSCTACVVTLDGRLNQLSYANLGDSGVILLRHVNSEVHLGSSSLRFDKLCVHVSCVCFWFKTIF